MTTLCVLPEKSMDIRVVKKKVFNMQGRGTLLICCPLWSMVIYIYFLIPVNFNNDMLFRDYTS